MKYRGLKKTASTPWMMTVLKGERRQDVKLRVSSINFAFVNSLEITDPISKEDFLALVGTLNHRKLDDVWQIEYRRLCEKYQDATLPTKIRSFALSIRTKLWERGYFLPKRDVGGIR